jgi:hypothetical protein
MVDALGSGILSLIIAATVSAFANSGAFSNSIFSGEAYLALFSLAKLPLLLTLLGLVAAVYRAGPFGFFGFLFELAGVNTLITDPDGGALAGIALGAILVVFGASIWSWTSVLEVLINSRKQRSPPRGRI